jgi:rare lipoprotein A
MVSAFINAVLQKHSDQPVPGRNRHMIRRRVSCVAYLPVTFMTLPSAARVFSASALALFLANCASEPSRSTRQISAQNQREIGAFADRRKYGSASPRVVNYGSTVPKGGGREHVGRPYRIAGRWYTPRENPNYSATGQASWYGDAFHGRKTANGEIYDKYAYTAAHPTMPLPSYARVTNMSNSRSIIVRVNDRGPFHGNRIIDLSERVATALEFKHIGTARVRVDYVGRASTAGSDDRKLLATLTNDGAAQLPGGSSPVPAAAQRVMVASAGGAIPGLALASPASAQPVVTREVQPTAVQQPSAPPPQEVERRPEESTPTLVSEARPVRRLMPLPQDRPFDLESIPGAATPMDRVNNGQGTPARAATPTGQPLRQRVAAVYFAPTEGFNAVFGANDPMQRLRSGQFDAPQPATVNARNQTLVAGLFREKANADRLAKVLAGHGNPWIEEVRAGQYLTYRVTASGFASEAAARAALAATRAAGAADAVIR